MYRTGTDLVGQAIHPLCHRHQPDSDIDPSNPTTGFLGKCTDLDSWSTWGAYWPYYLGSKVPTLDDISLNSMQQTTALIILDAATSPSI